MAAVSAYLEKNLAGYAGKLARLLQTDKGPQAPVVGFEWVRRELERIGHYSGKKWTGMDGVDPLRRPEDTKGPTPFMAAQEGEDRWE